MKIMITRDRFCRNQANLSLKHICARLVDTQENKWLFQRLPPLKVLFYYLFLVNHPYFFMLLFMSLQYPGGHIVFEGDSGGPSSLRRCSQSPYSA